MRSAQLVAVLALATGIARAQPAPEPEPAPGLAPEPPPSSAPAAPEAAAPTTKPPDQRAIPEDLAALAPDAGFRFGSYGRVIAGTDLRGGKPEQLLIVAHGPR